MGPTNQEKGINITDTESTSLLLYRKSTLKNRVQKISFCIN